MPHDGTQDPGPPPLMPDALTGRTYDTEAVRVRVVEPVMPDMSAVHEAMKAVLDDDDVPESRPVVTDDPPAGGIPAPRAEQGAPPESPAERTLPRIPAARMPAPAEVTNTATTVRRRRGFTPGASAIVALLLVFAVLVVILIVSLVDTISSLFS